MEGFESPAAADLRCLPKPAKEALSAPAGRSGQESLGGLAGLHETRTACQISILSVPAGFIPGNQR